MPLGKGGNCRLKRTRKSKNNIVNLDKFKYPGSDELYPRKDSPKLFNPVLLYKPLCLCTLSTC